MPDIQSFKAAIAADDLAGAEAALRCNAVVEAINSGIFPCGRPALLAARSPQMIDLLLNGGADIDCVGTFWASGFGLDTVPGEIGLQLIARGAVPTVHAAAALGLTICLRDLLDADPKQVAAPGGDGATPLHFARSVDVAAILLEYGADENARDDDHRSTPAQWRIKTGPDVSRYLLANGAEADVFLAAALGDLDLTQRVVAADPQCVAYRIGTNSGPFPGIGFEGRGGTILQWQLGFNLAPQEVAKKRGHNAVYERLMDLTPARYQLPIACMLADRELAMSLLASHPQLVATFDNDDRTLLARACWETGNDTDVIRLMLDCGFPVGIPEHNHGYSPLHNAAWCGNAEVVRLLIEHGHPIDLIDPKFDASAAGYAIHSATEARRYPDADYAGVVDALIHAGLDSCLSSYPVNHDAIDSVLRRHLGQKSRQPGQ